jgi:predicted CoA-binding protein
MGSPRRVAVLGASRHRHKYGNKAVRAYRAAGWEVLPVHPSAASIAGSPAFRRLADLAPPIDRITVYLPPPTVLALASEIAAVRAGDVFLNPGSASPEAVAALRRLGVEPVLACSIVDIGRDPEHPD